ncbi:MAG: SRPBCC family protein [Acidobacteria bacterium]|nr:SRPBCC family protein [Acidobacteriota bacterium]
MFTIKASYSDQIELEAPLERVREFFADLTNFAALMPGVAKVVIDNKGVAHWEIETTIPVVGLMRQRFMLELAEDSEDRIEWFPIREETRNFLRFSADFLERSANRTLVHFTQMVEMRRQSARDLHTLAGLAGETIISNEMTRRVTEMIQTFITRAKEKLEK